MDAGGADTNELRMAKPAVAVSSSRSVSRTAFTAFMRETNELGAALNASSPVLHMDSREAKETGEADGGLEVAAVTASLESPDIRENTYTARQTTPGGGRDTRSRKPQIGYRSRFRPWGYT